MDQKLLVTYIKPVIQSLQDDGLKITRADVWLGDIREFVRNNLPILVIIFSLIKTNYSRNNGLFKNKSTKSKGNRIAKMGKLFLTNSLNGYGHYSSVFIVSSKILTNINRENLKK
jgi:hypothetical protein